MFHRQLNRLQLELSLKPHGPILIRRGRAGADPTRPSLEWVRTTVDGEPSVYLPGSSLKGVLRSHAERLLRSEGLAITATFDEAARHALSQRTPGDEAHRETCPLGRTFGSLHLRSRLALSDLVPGGFDLPGSAARRAELERANATEDRNGVAIDRLLGSVHGNALYDQEVVVAGRFDGRLVLQNFQLYQLGLLLFLLRDLDAGYVQLGSSTSRGFGWVGVTLHRLVIESRRGRAAPGTLAGLGGLEDAERAARYRLFGGDTIELAPGWSPRPDAAGLFERLELGAEDREELERRLGAGPWQRFLDEAQGQRWAA
jgi:CRISPR/Cas system CSM-associated protein Csm3 (group 7 of RAMP superfamily)